ncbi:MAG: transporter substrate-binding domain-containing protein [Heliobacteriaceae bacterium]|jgi:putative glutamine transport system substrate-binding protein|nr:transporter substrate-binding domain-containing protein [Heliobacteriaceae bacterium]
MKKIILAASLILLIGFLACGCGKEVMIDDDLAVIMRRDKLIVGVREDTRPFSYRGANGKLAGYDVELAKQTAKYILGTDTKLELVPVTASNRIMKLNTREVDMLIATMSITPEREQILDFSLPYYIAGQAIMVNRSSNATSLKDFNNKRMIIVFGSTSAENLRTNTPEVNVAGYKDYNAAYRALKAGKADGMIADDTILMGFAMNDGSVKILQQRYTREPYAAAFRKGPESGRLREKVDYVIEKQRRSIFPKGDF